MKMKTKFKVTLVSVKLPFMLRWLKRYVKLECKVIKQDFTELKGHKIDLVICDDIGDYK